MFFYSKEGKHMIETRFWNGAVSVGRDEALKIIWRHTHADFKGKRDDGSKCLNVLRGGTCSVDLNDLTDEEVAARLPHCMVKEGQRLLAKGEK